jgi:two-component system sensor histidine kinase SenX3
LLILNNLRREWKAYVSHRLWILGVLLLVLCALALVQYHWIDQVAEAERQRAKTDLTANLAGLENDFDIEITRVFEVFQFPTVDRSDYSERYREWLRRAPYPSLVRGVYILETRKTGSLLTPAVPGEPRIRSTDWQRDLPKLAPFSATTASAPAGSAPGFQMFSQGGFIGSFGVSNPGAQIDGNPAFVFPIMPAMPRVTTQAVTSSRGAAPSFGAIEIGRVADALPSQWAVVVLDANYIEATFLPRLLKVHFPNGSASEYDILVVNKTRSAPPGIIFHSEAAPPENQFAHPDGSISLLALRLDCFSPPSFTSNMGIADARIVQLRRRSNPWFRSADTGIVGAGRLQVVTGPDRLSEILSRTPPSCGNPGPALGGSPAGSWEMLVRYRAGSLDQVMATFRHRSLLLSGSVLLVLALGICMLVLLTERARTLAEMQTEFVLGVSHELRTPLTVICVAGDNLKQGIVKNSEQAHKYGEIITTHASELSNMIEEALAFARIQSGAPIGKRTPVPPEQIVRASLANCEQALQNAGIAVELDLAPDLPLVDVDARLVDRCLANLIQNVVKYAAAGRWMAVRVEKVIRPEGKRVQISVEDRGPGISPDDLPHIFEPFYRGRYGEASQAPGVGLGLTLVKRVVEAHLGRVEVKSSDTGALFSISLRTYQGQSGTQKVV